MDVLFFGGLNPQREAIIADVNATGVSVRVLAGGTMKFGEDLDKVLARTKIVLNLHYYHGVMVRHPAPGRLLGSYKRTLLFLLIALFSGRLPSLLAAGSCMLTMRSDYSHGHVSPTLLVLSSPQLVVRALH